MPVFVENPFEFSKQRLKSELISHKVKLPPADSEKQVYVELYMKHVGKKSSSSLDFSSDEEEAVMNGNEEDKRGDEADMVDLSSLTDDQLKHKLLQYGIKPGPVVGSTRRLYERKLLRLMTHHSQYSVNSKSNAGKFSDSEEDEEEENEEDSGSEKHGSEAVTDVLMEMFPDAAVTPTGITATKRRTIKGAAGRPVQFKYPQTPASPGTLERREIQQRLVPLWVQVVVFLLVAALLYVIYISMEELPENPFSTLLDSLSQEPVSEELVLNTQETNT